MPYDQALLSPTIFRAYDIRGIVGETLTEDSVRLIGQAFGSLVQEEGETHVVVARDGRLSGPTLSKALIEGICQSGCHVTDIGMAPTPLLYFATVKLPQHAGVMLTGSHNPSNYNGLKMVMQGKALAEVQIQTLYQRIIEKRLSQGAGIVTERDLTAQYAAEMLDQIQLKRPLNIVIDSGNGVAGQLAPMLFRKMGCDVHELFCEVDGHFPHHHPDPSQPENLQALIRAVRENKADIGLAFDGDGDRLGAVTSDGDIVWPDRILMLFAKSLLAKHQNAKIIYDVKCTRHLAILIKQLGGEAIMWKTGHSFIKAKLAEINAAIAGEMSGHFFFKDRWYGFDDALYAGARLLEILAEQTKQSAALFAEIPDSVSTAELKVAVSDEEKFQLMQRLTDEANFSDAKDINTIDGLRINFADGWGLIRPSNTTPYLVLRFEAINETILKNIQDLFRVWMLSVKPDLVLPF